MTDPMWTVVLLAVLWLIVVVPMILRRRDERAGQRSVARFGASMRALSRRSVVRSEPLMKPEENDDRPTVFVNGPGAVTRRPVPASEESLMYPPDQHEMSAARRQMMARRRRSLAILSAGSVVFLLLALITGSALAWTPAVLLLVGLGGYLLFLRSQARRDRERRRHDARGGPRHRQRRAHPRKGRRLAVLLTYLVRQLIVEALLLGACGAGLGLLLGAWAVRTFAASFSMARRGSLSRRSPNAVVVRPPG